MSSNIVAASLSAMQKLVAKSLEWAASVNDIIFGVVCCAYRHPHIENLDKENL